MRGGRTAREAPGARCGAGTALGAVASPVLVPRSGWDRARPRRAWVGVRRVPPGITAARGEQCRGTAGARWLCQDRTRPILAAARRRSHRLILNIPVLKLAPVRAAEPGPGGRRFPPAPASRCPGAVPPRLLVPRCWGGFGCWVLPPHGVPAGLPGSSIPLQGCPGRGGVPPPTRWSLREGARWNWQRWALPAPTRSQARPCGAWAGRERGRSRGGSPESPPSTAWETCPCGCCRGMGKLRQGWGVLQPGWGVRFFLHPRGGLGELGAPTLPLPTPAQIQGAGRGAGLGSRLLCAAFGVSLSPMGAVPWHGGTEGASAPAQHRSMAGLMGWGLGGA